MKITILDGARRAKIWASMAGFGNSITSEQRHYARNDGLPLTQLVGLMGWIWTQWLLDGPASLIRQQLRCLLDRGLRIRALSDLMRHRSRYDLFMLHCAVFAAGDAQLKQVAEVVVDSAGW